MGEKFSPLVEVMGLDMQTHTIFGPTADDDLGAGGAVQIKEVESIVAVTFAADNFLSADRHEGTLQNVGLPLLIEVGILSSLT